jgi:hypothetical protein
MALWRAGAGGALGGVAVDMTLRLDNAGGAHIPTATATTSPCSSTISGDRSGDAFLALIVSWIVAVLFAPLLGVAMLPKRCRDAAAPRGKRTSRPVQPHADFLIAQQAAGSGQRLPPS